MYKTLYLSTSTNHLLPPSLLPTGPELTDPGTDLANLPSFCGTVLKRALFHFTFRISAPRITPVLFSSPAPHHLISSHSFYDTLNTQCCVRSSQNQGTTCSHYSKCNQLLARNGLCEKNTHCRGIPQTRSRALRVTNCSERFPCQALRHDRGCRSNRPTERMRLATMRISSRSTHHQNLLPLLGFMSGWFWCLCSWSFRLFFRFVFLF
ncbi:hypothetical protein HOY80DRAFT_664709 [Tuber brumale]|nr:hypothetical protein HOY80DRAFT_664709 [Tuber brumale]